MCTGAMIAGRSEQAICTKRRSHRDIQAKEHIALQDSTRPNFDLEQVGEKEGDVSDEENLRQALQHT
jgi:hypothetical protein